MNRRDALRTVAAVAGAALPLAAACRGRGRAAGPLPPSSPGAARGDAPGGSASPAAMPALFVAHGSPLLMDDARWVAELGRWSAALPRPRAILMVSAHWGTRPIAVGATTTVPLVHDFSGFPDQYYQVEYPAPGAPELAARVHALLEPSQPVADVPDRGLDHGAYVPLLAMYPKADVPVLQLSLPTLEPATLFALGRALAPLRREGVLVVGSGFLTHNMRTLDLRPDAPTPAWAAEFDAWSAEKLDARDVDALLDYRQRAPGVAMALPTHEHFVPVLVALGAASDGGGPPGRAVTFPITGFMAGSFTRRSVQLG